MISLTRFHSPITKQKLSLIKPTIPTIPYSSYDEINVKFKEFLSKCKNPNPINEENKSPPQKKKSQSVKRMTMRRSSITPQFHRKATQRLSMKLDYDALKSTLGDTEDLELIVKEKYEKNQEMMDHGEINPVVKLFGSTLIGAVFQALIIKCVEEVCSVRPDETSAMSSKVLNYFGISTIHLKLLKSQEAKRNYIIKCMNATIDNLLKTWREKIELQEKLHQQNNKEYENLKNRNKDEIKDRFPWLELKTKYISLQKKLKALIIQKLNNYETQMGVIATLQKRESLTKSLLKIPHDELKISLHDITFPKTSSLMNKTAKTESGEGSQMKSSILKKGRSHNGFKNYSIDTRISTSSSSQVNQRDLTFTNSKIERFLEKDSQKKLEDNLSRIQNKEIEWDEDFEVKFKKYMAQGRKLFFNEMKNAKFYEVGVMSMIQELFKDEKKNLERAECLDRYADGGYLTAEELRFLADTSNLLNSCVDKTYIKKVVRLIDPNILNYIELNLAESIITKYKEMREIIVKARNKFIKKNNDALKHRLNDFEAEKQKKQEIAQQIKNRHYFSKSIKPVIKKIEDNQDKYEEFFHNSILTEMNSPTKNFTLEEKFEEYNKSKPYKRVTPEKPKNYSQPKEIDVYCNPSHPNIVRHKYHPSSKIFFIAPAENEETPNKYMNIVMKDIERFKLQIKSPNSLKDKDTFVKFYSGGPTQNNDQPLYKYPNIQRAPTSFEIKAITRLQRRIRGYLARKKFKEMLLQIKQKNLCKFQEKLKAIKFKPQKSSAIMKRIASFSSSSPKLMREGSRNEKNEDPNDARTQKIINKSPPKNLLLKHRKLLEATVKNNMFMAKNSGFAWYPNDMNVKDKKGNVPLYYAAKHANFEFCTFLIEQGAKVNEHCENGNTPFHIAFLKNCLEIIMLMLDHGGNLNNINNLGQTPLAYASLLTLKKLDLESGVATSGGSLIHPFDNNRLLSCKKPIETYQTNEFCNFQLDKMVQPRDNVRLLDETNNTHLVSYNNEKLEKEGSKKNSEIVLDEVCSLPVVKERTSSPTKKKILMK